MKKPLLFYTIADANNMPYATSMWNSFKKFHPDVDTYTVTGDELAEYLKNDPAFFYRATPILSERFLKDYELVVKIDADSVVLGDLSYIWETKDYDVATVINWNRIDPEQFGLVGGWGILPTEYMNAGLVAIRSEKFAHHWNVLCFTPQFDRLQYKEQDLLNVLCYFGNYNVRCLDHGDGPAKVNAWWGLISKGEWTRAVLKEGKIFIPKGEGDQPFPDKDTELKIVHMAGGAGTKKDNWQVYFPEAIYTRIKELIS